MNVFRENRERISMVLLDVAMPVMGGRVARAELAGIDPK